MNMFQNIRTSRPKRNKFDLSHERKMSINMGKLYPIICQEIVPGDSFRVNSEIMMRFAPMLAPVMHRINVYTHYFFVPNRLIWDEWEDFITGGREGTSEPVWPHVQMTDANIDWFGIGDLSDYMGIPPMSAGTSLSTPDISALPFRAYSLCYDEYYRDQNLEASLDISKSSGVQAGAELAKIMELRFRAWEKDYFTSALPWAQRGPEVLIPIEGEGSVNYYEQSYLAEPDGSPVTSGAVGSMGGNPTQLRAELGTANQPIRVENIESIEFENSTVTINELRRSVRLQEWLEKNARGGARYVEQILSHFGVRSSDARLQRPEYLGGGKNPVVITEVLSTYQDATGTGEPQANMAGHGISFGKTNGFKRTFEEHGFVIGIMSVLPRTAYQQGINKMFSRVDRFDYYWPEFANIGEQEIKNKEIFTSNLQSGNDLEGTFGYQSRYAEYKYSPSTVHGEFRNTLAFWHMGRIFNSKPSLNAGFVLATDVTDRIFAVPGASENLYAYVYNRIDALRPMPYFGTPTL